MGNLPLFYTIITHATTKREIFIFCAPDVKPNRIRFKSNLCKVPTARNSGFFIKKSI